MKRSHGSPLRLSPFPGYSILPLSSALGMMPNWLPSQASSIDDRHSHSLALPFLLSFSQLAMHAVLHTWHVSTSRAFSCTIWPLDGIKNTAAGTHPFWLQSSIASPYRCTFQSRLFWFLKPPCSLRLFFSRALSDWSSRIVSCTEWVFCLTFFSLGSNTLPLPPLPFSIRVQIHTRVRGWSYLKALYLCDCLCS